MPNPGHGRGGRQPPSPRLRVREGYENSSLSAEKGLESEGEGGLCPAGGWWAEAEPALAAVLLSWGNI